MNDTLADWISLSVEVLITSVIVFSLVSILSASQQVNMGIMEQQAIAAEMQEYRVHNGYDDTVVHQQDIISAIFKNRGSPSVAVTSSKGTYSWTLSSAACDYTASEISALIAPDVVYDSEIVKGLSGEVIGYTFKPHVEGDACPTEGYREVVTYDWFCRCGAHGEGLSTEIDACTSCGNTPTCNKVITKVNC